MKQMQSCRSRKSLMMFACILVLYAACSRESPYTQESFVMGTMAQVTIFGMEAGDAEAAASAALNELHSVESVMSTWKERSEISVLNRESLGKPLLMSIELYSVIDSSVYYSEKTFGAFDITARPLVTMWGFQGGTPVLPDRERIAEALDHVGSEKIIWGEHSPRIGLPPGMELDLAGIAKGYAVDRCVVILKSYGVTSGLVNLGGNIYAIGAPPGKESWSIGIRNPVDTEQVIGSFSLRDDAVATSGNYENFVEIEGKRYGHIIDPRTGYPVDHVLSVTVIASTALAADALSGWVQQGEGGQSGYRVDFLVGPPRDAGVAKVQSTPGSAGPLARRGRARRARSPELPREFGNRLPKRYPRDA